MGNLLRYSGISGKALKLRFFANLLGLIALSYLATSCQGVRGTTSSNSPTPNPPTPSGPPTLTVTAQPQNVIIGTSVTLTWTSTNATAVTLDNGIGSVALSGSKSEIPPTTTTYTGTATGPKGTVNTSVTVNVGGLQGFQLTAKPTTIFQGQSAVLSFSAPGADSVSIDHNVGTFGASGTANVMPTATTTYTGTASFKGATMTATATVTVTPPLPPPTVTLDAAPDTINGGGSSTLSWTSTNATTLSIDQGVGPVTVPAGSTVVSPSATTIYTITATNDGQGSGPTAKATATVNVNSTIPQLGGVFTNKYDNQRTGQNVNEALLTPANVNQTQFGKVFSFGVDGFVYGQPLYAQQVNVAGQGIHNVVYVATEHDSVYAFDADGKSNAPLWHVSFINPSAGITTVPTADVGSTIFPEIGITSTPVIDPQTGTIYVEAMTKENGNYFQRLHALDMTSGTEKFGGPVAISGSVPGTGVGNDGTGHVPFQPKLGLQRAGLLLANNTIYIAFASHGDNGAYHGWVFGYDPVALNQVGIWNDTPNGQDGGIWQGGGGLAADNAGAIYGMSGNGTAEGGPDYSDSFFKLRQGSGGLSVDSFFTPLNQQALSSGDIDVGAGGPLLLPDQSGAHAHEVTGAGKEGKIYLVDRDNMGSFNLGFDNDVQELAHAVGNNGATDNNFETPSFWQNRVYFIGAVDVAKAFTLANGSLSTAPESKTLNAFGVPGATPIVSSSGNTNGILWAIERAGVLHAYDATNLAIELYNSNQNAGRDALGVAVRFSAPTVANGRVYVGTKSQLVVYGLLK